MWGPQQAYNIDGKNYVLDKNSPYNDKTIKFTDSLSTWGKAETLDDHYGRHAKDFNVINKQDYVEKANEFYQNRNQYQVMIGKDGITRVYDFSTNTFGAYNPNGTTATFFKPTSKNYFKNQANK